MSILSKVKLGLGAAKLFVKVNAPTILMVTGIGAGIGCVATACVQSTKVSEIIDETKEEMAKADAVLAGTIPVKEGETYTSEDHDKDIKIFKGQMIRKIALLYLIPFLLGATSLLCILGGYKILNDRNVALSTAFNGLSAAFAQYRERVRKEAGPDWDRHFRYGTRVDKISVTDENGNEKTEYKEFLPETGFHFDGDPVAYEFGMGTSTEFEANFNRRPQNWFLLKETLEWTKMRVQTTGHCFLNEVLGRLGLPECYAGQILGWRKAFTDDPEEAFRCPPVDFGLENIKEIYSGYDIEHLESYPLLFNCISIAGNTRMWDRDRPYASILKPRWR